MTDAVRFFLLKSMGVLCALLALGCTEGQPEFKDLGKLLNAPRLDNSSQIFTITSLNEALKIPGACDRRGQRLELRQGLGDWVEANQVAQSESDLDCSDQRFNLQISNVGEWLGFSGWHGEEKLLNLRFSGPLFLPVEAQIRVRYQDSGPRLARGRLQGFIALAEPSVHVDQGPGKQFWAEYSLGEAVQALQLQSGEDTPHYRAVISVQGILTQVSGSVE